MRWPRPLAAALSGRHGVHNALAALAAATLAGADPEAIADGLERFRGVKDRLETLAEIDGVTYINDTTATAPMATAAAFDALETWDGSIHLLAGGADKGLDPAPLTDAAARHGAHVYLFEGTASPAIERALRVRGIVPRGPFSGMAEAVTEATRAARPGDVILLSPGCASFGLFLDEFDRGEQFRETVAALTALILPRSIMEVNTRQIGDGVGLPDSGASDELLPPAPAHVHFVGVGGIGMSGLARILNVWGYAVSGSDSTPRHCWRSWLRRV